LIAPPIALLLADAAQFSPLVADLSAGFTLLRMENNS